MIEGIKDERSERAGPKQNQSSTAKHSRIYGGQGNEGDKGNGQSKEWGI
ncbi:MAG: hypothetical protein ACE5Q6_12715 [Dehalococcoidia bacterium]